MKTEPLIIEKTYNSPIAKVWEAITDHSKMKEWYFKMDDFKPEVGFEFTFVGTGSDGVKYVHLCKITEVIPYEKLSHTWTCKDIAGKSTVTWELFDEDGKTRLKLTHTGLETFPQDKPTFGKDSFTKGWTYITGTSLFNYLEKA